ncbi:hypothetical protein EYF80_001844 [Liparis tanakae]|uniref:Uncharacterized protein n=1 Tax=Liparis tanakae TaxID=230148 RepID=A0A4Z2JCI7_9TELE|nr:hypothetical protein EYF80_001844 [Liparis tanakae]
MTGYSITMATVLRGQKITHKSHDGMELSDKTGSPVQWALAGFNQPLRDETIINRNQQRDRQNSRPADVQES